MAKVTEQDLIKLGFTHIMGRLWVKHFSGKGRRLHRPRLYVLYSPKSNKNIITLNTYHDELDRKHLTHENLDLFIRFAKGEKL